MKIFNRIPALCSKWMRESKAFQAIGLCLGLGMSGMEAQSAALGAASSVPTLLMRESCGVPGNVLAPAGTSGGNNAVDPGEFVEVRFAFTNQSSTPLGSLSIFLVNSNGVSGAFGAKFVAGPVAPGARVEADLTFLPIGLPGDIVRPHVQVVLGAAGTEYVPFEIQLGKEVVQTSSFPNPAPVTIPSIGQGSIYPSPATVPPSFTGTLSSVKVRLKGLSHARPNDLQALLVSPAGQAIVLMNGVGGETPAGPVDLLFDSAATSSLGASGSLVSGTFRPSATPGALPLLAPAPGPPYSLDLNTLLGKSPVGSWSLYLSDSTTVDGGALAGGWTLELATREIQSCISPSTPVLTGAPSSTVSINEDTPLNLSLNLSDDTTPASDLLLTVRSSNLVLIPETAITISGTGAVRQVSILPATNRFGTGTESGSMISIRIQDRDGLYVERQFRLDVQAVNDPPTISSIPNIPLGINGVSDELLVTIGDVETEPSRLSLFASSSQPSVIPESRVQLVGTGTQRKLTIRPALDVSGFSTITLTLLDEGGAISSTSFLVVVSSPNAFPIISDTSNQTMQQDRSILLSFTVSDRETAATDLLVSVSATDTNLVPASGLLLGGSGSSRTLTVTPARGLSGHATVTIRVGDASGQVSSDSFELVVNPAGPPANFPPRISQVPAQTVPTGQSLILALSVSDPETPPGALKLMGSSDFTSLLPDQGISFAFADGVWVMTATPLPNQSGSTRITVRVEDAAGTAVSIVFRATFEDLNAPPEITSFPDLQLEAGAASAPISFNVADQETALEQLAVTGTVSNPALASLTFQGSGFDRRLVVKAAGGKGGSGQVTVTVTDRSGKSASASFKLDVAPEPVVIAPLMSVKLSAGRLEISWPSTSVGFLLETAADPAARAWENLGPGGIPAGGLYKVAVQADQGARFFRLRRP